MSLKLKENHVLSVTLGVTKPVTGVTGVTIATNVTLKNYFEIKGETWRTPEARGTCLKCQDVSRRG